MSINLISPCLGFEPTFTWMLGGGLNTHTTDIISLPLYFDLYGDHGIWMGGPEGIGATNWTARRPNMTIALLLRSYFIPTYWFSVQSLILKPFLWLQRSSSSRLKANCCPLVMGKKKKELANQITIKARGLNINFIDVVAKRRSIDYQLNHSL